ncbi:ligand-dependent corepressor-like [Lampris incognitus]|uniref:ligand-dependent corepressor-like n=1 Tax=Lampris incognitus TaxID=2546036 RepID=UPI0024B4965D|nr:ligand-dependent corepressor-like [Lampris incognitus]
MASLCRRQQCTIERRGFRQELDSWRHKLLHCVGFESILEGLFGPALIEDLKLFKDCEPEAVSDWSFDENCLFCCLRRDKVKEHLVGLSNQGLEDTPKPLLVKDQTKINRLEKQAEEFLHAVLCRKDVPSFLDPHIPVVAREIMQRMIRQFAAEYTSKTSSPQDSLSDPQPSSDQSLPRPPSCSVASPSTSPGTALTTPAHNQNPVLSKLLMADQDAPLDLTIKKPVAEPDEQEGVLDLSLKKNRNLPVHSPYVSPTTSTLKGRSLRADGHVEVLMRSLQDGRRRENIGHSTHYKPFQPLAYSLHIKEEVGLAQESDPESPPSQHQSSRHTDLVRNGSPNCNSKTHFGALLKLRANSEATEHLKDLPRLLEAAGIFSKSLSPGKVPPQEAQGERDLSLFQSSPFDLKIPQVRGLSLGTDHSWGSLTSASSSPTDNSLGKKLRSILPKHSRKGSSGALVCTGADKDYWAYDIDRPFLGGNYPPLDGELDLGSKQPRKKRGRYRQYNTELLEEAIVVVMGGKMSVSKAQSVYGIPHSTLEYKVKERLGTLKHPPKKKLRLISQPVEEHLSESLESKEGIQNYQCTASEENKFVSTENGSESLNSGLSPDE